jgi:3-dehydroquinate synthase
MPLADRENLVLVGMMGAGKGSVGACLGRVLGRPLVDTDDLVERIAGKPVAAVFTQAGEAGFRRLERRALQSLDGLRGTVIATGGGAVLDPGNRRLLRRLGPVVWLRASAGTMAARSGAGTAAAESRPLLAGLDRDSAARCLERLAGDRAPLYESIASVTVDADLLTPDKLALRIMDRVEVLAGGKPSRLPAPAPPSPRRCGVQLDTAARHAVFCGPGLLDSTICFEGLAGGGGRRGLLVTDALAGALYARKVLASAAGAGLDLETAQVPRGEAAKSPSALVGLYRRMLAGSIGRDGLVVALGGGAVGDVAGFAAATFARGVDHVQLPTTLLAQVDSSLGGKTAIDLDGVKNPVGAFHQPVAVIADVSALRTLPLREMRSGLAEMLKYGLCYDEPLWEQALAWGRGFAAPPGAGFDEDLAAELVSCCLRHKAAVVAGDERESGPRVALNFGHTLGHAVEGLAAGKLRHGEAIALGMDFAAWLGERQGLTEPGTASCLREGLRSAGLLPAKAAGDARNGPAVWGRGGGRSGPGALLPLLFRDKKTRGGRPRFVFLKRIGAVCPEPVEVPSAELERCLAAWLASF